MIARRRYSEHPPRDEYSDGGALFLYVGYHGIISSGGGVAASHGYVFGFRGYLNFK